MDGPHPSPKIERRAVPLALPALYFAQFCAFGVFLPFLPVWLVARGIDGPALGLTLAAPYVVGVLAPILFGSLADALGQRARLLGFAAGLALFAAACMGAAATWSPAGSARALILAVLISVIALARAPLFGLTDVLALEALGSDRSRFGTLRLWGSAGFLLTAVLFPIAFEPTSALAMPLAMGAGYVATMMVTRSLPASSAKLGLDVGDTARMIGRRAPFFAALMLWQFGNATYDSTFTLHLTEIGVPRAWLGVAWGIGVLAEIVVMALTPLLVSRWRAKHLLVVGLSIAMARWFLLARIESHALLLLSQVMHAGSFALTCTVANIELPRVASAGRLATAQGAFATTAALGSALGMLIWPVVHRDAGASAVFTGGGVAAMLAVLIVAFGERRPVELSPGSSGSRP